MKRDNLLIIYFCLFFLLPGIISSIDENSFYPLLISLALLVCFSVIYGIVSFIKKWRSKRRFSKLSPGELATLFKDFSNQAKWDKEASRALNELLDGEKK